MTLRLPPGTTVQRWYKPVWYRSTNVQVLPHVICYYRSLRSLECNIQRHSVQAKRYLTMRSIPSRFSEYQLCVKEYRPKIVIYCTYTLYLRVYYYTCINYVIYYLCVATCWSQSVLYCRFASNLSGYLTSCENSDVVAVHCTHGLNRTGYLVCRYVYSVYKAVCANFNMYVLSLRMNVKTSGTVLLFGGPFPFCCVLNNVIYYC